MSRIFEALQYAEKERQQRDKTEQLRDETQSQPIPAAVNANTDQSSCKRCVAGRILRDGIIDFLCRLMGLYPWQCLRCQRRFRRFRRY